MTDGDPTSPHREFRGTARFRPLAPVGRGGMGVVYRVIDEELGAEVALKTLEELSPEQVYRLKSEFRSIAGVFHPNLAQLHELVVTDDACFFTMELVDGVDFVRWVRGADDETTGDDARVRRLGQAAVQLVDGLGALHAAFRLHRDVKPTNVLVASDGRVVLLDFDLVVVAGDPARDERPGTTGTFAYMAPEQAWGRTVGPAADLYAVGAMLFEALTGRLPFAGSFSEMLFAKESQPPPSVRALAAGVPEPLDALVRALLDPDPARRPVAGEVLARLGGPGVRLPPRTPPLEGVPLVGREAELARMEALVAGAPAGVTTVLRVRGASGIGKTALVRRFVHALAADPSVLVLQGRCHPQESIPYRALDGVVDALTRFLLALPPDASGALLPRHAYALVRLFPVFGRLPALAESAARRGDVDALETRRRSILAFRSLLARIGRRRRLVLWVDDAQWGDADSATLLAELLRPPDAPTLFLILSHRADPTGDAPLERQLEALAAEHGGPRLNALDVGPLDEAASRTLAASLCGAQRGADAVRLAAQSGGSPFLLTTMAWHRLAYETTPAGAAGAVDLEQVLRARLDELPPDDRRLMELVATAGAPIERSVALAAARCGEAGRPVAARLESRLFLRATAVDDRPALETYHDRIREAALAALDAGQRATHHAALAEAFDASGAAEPDVLARHFHGAGMLDRAADHAVAAAEKAADSLAFVSAAEFYRLAREWDPRDADRQRFLLEREGDALANAARFVEGASALNAAAGGAPRAQALELRRRAAEHLLASGHVDQGTAVLGALLSDLGLAYPRTQARAMLRSAVHLGRLLVRGIEPRPARPDGDALLRVDTCYSAGKGLVDIDPPRGVYFSLEALRRALETDDPVRLGCTLSVVGGSLRVVGGGVLDRLGTRMLERAARLAQATGSPLLAGTMAIATGQVLMLHGRWRESIERSDAGARQLAETCRGVAFLCNIGRGIPVRAVEELGDLVALGIRARELLQAGAVLGDRFAETIGSQHLSTVLLARDDPTAARDHERHVAQRWPRDSFLLQHLYALRQAAMCDLYQGRAEGSYQRLLAAWPKARRAQLLRVSLARIDALSIRGRLALALACRDGAAGSLAGVARKDAAALLRERRDDATVHARLLQAGLATLDGDPPGAVRALDAARTAAERAAMSLHAAVAAYRRASLHGDRGTEGRSERDAAAAQMSAFGVHDADRWAALYAPGRFG